jgi:predicted metal-dependent hydrolase
MTERRDLPAEYRQFLLAFARGDYWASHELLEQAWQRTGSEYFHGLILLASAFVHLERRNLHGVGAQLDKAIASLSGYCPHYLGLDVARLVEHLVHARSLLGDAEAGAPDGWALAIAAPALEVEEHLIRGTEPEMGSA